MNIAYILHSTCANDGATKAFLNMMDGIMTYGVKPYIVVPDKGEIFNELNERQIPTLVVNFRASAYPHSKTMKQRLLFLPRLAARIIVNQKATIAVTAWIRKNRIDIVHSNSSIIRIGFDAAQKVGVPHVYHIREYFDRIGIRYFPTKASFYQQLECSHSYSICITKAIQEHFQQDNRGNMSRVIYDGVFHEMTVTPKSETKNYFLFAGRIQPAKGLDQLLNAYKQYSEKASNPLPLKVAGGCADEAYYRKQLKYVEENHLTSLVDFLGNRNDIKELMIKARVLIVSSPFEGFGFCMPEAMQQGCLVIARNTSGTKEQLDNGLEKEENEIALRYETAEELAKILSEVASHPAEYYLQIVERAFRTVNKLYTIENNAKNIFQFYIDISRN
jgi:glycosyltransferase involved in cell wall biosynthesis